MLNGVFMRGACGCAILLAGGIAVSSPAYADETGLASIHAWRAERGMTCMVDHYHQGSGEGPTKSRARAAAITSWQEFTAFEYGTDWAYFRYAGSKSVGYMKTPDGWQATVEGRPCNRRRRQ
jgi:hypothetical protein